MIIMMWFVNTFEITFLVLEAPSDGRPGDLRRVT
jgi:hypothetical protein